MPVFAPISASRRQRAASLRTGWCSPAATTPDKHFARHRLADLFLDTLPYNAHTTASDALWMGLPVITTPGTAFPARVAASILKAANLPELIAPDLAEYGALLPYSRARDNQAHAAIRKKLTAKDNMPLFDTTRFTRNLEAAYSDMLDKA